MASQKLRIDAAMRTKLVMLFSAIQADVPNKTIDELHKLATDFATPRPIAKSTVQAILKDMGLAYKPYKNLPLQESRTLQRDTLRAVCAWIVQFDNSLPADALIRRFIKP